ncbi:diguanylate cyclase [Aeromicrobium sp. UC242_57]|uniref:diguanylate cyclase n=1 Tax=Aeromicrobium sp. UC242_57 TaxID=3374624 RepID=UPI0037B459B1
MTTLLTCCALATVTVAAVFATTAALRHNDEANRAWVAGLASAMCATGLAAIYGLDDSTPSLVVATIDASSVFSVGAIWSGCRALDGRARSLIWIPLLAALLTALPTVIAGRPVDLDLSSTLRLGVTGFAAWLCAIQLMRGGMRLNLNSRILQVVLFTFGGWYLAAAAVYAAADSPVAQRPTVESTILPFTALFVVTAICLSALRVERAGNWWSMNAETARRTNLAVLTPEPFRDDARDRIERATMTGRHVALVLAEIDALDELNTAFGRETGDSAMMHFTQLLRSRVPASALIGHLGAGRFAILTVMTSADLPSNIVAAIRTGLLDASIGEDMEIRIDASFGTSHTADIAATFESLLAQATDDLERAHT